MFMQVVNIDICGIERWGSGGDSTSGCCTSCCKSSFDDDDFEKEEARLHQEALAREKARDAAAQGEQQESEGTVVSKQPTAEKSMEQPRRSSEGRATEPQS